MLKCKKNSTKIRVQVKDGLIQVITPDMVVKGKKLNVSGIKEGKLIAYSINFELLKEDANLEFELSCYYDEFIKEIAILKYRGKKWKVPVGYVNMKLQDIVRVNVNCWEEPSRDFQEQFNKINPEKITIRLANKKIEVYTVNRLCITADELVLDRCGFEYTLRIRSGCGVSHDVKEFLYLDSYYDYQEKLPILLLETRGEKYRIPFTTYHIFNVSIQIKKL